MKCSYDLVKYGIQQGDILKPGDCVTVVMKNMFDEFYWMPGIVQNINLNKSPEYAVIFYNGQKETYSRDELHKINPYSYGRIISFITQNGKYEILGKKEESSLKTFLTEDKQKFKKELIEELENNIKSIGQSKYQQKLNNELKKFDKEQDSYRKYVDKQIDTYREDLKIIKEKMSKIKIKSPSPVSTRPSSSASSANNNSENKTNQHQEKPNLPVKQIDELTSGNMVIAKNVEDGCYYPGTIVDRANQSQFKIEFSSRTMNLINKDDIYSMSSNHFTDFKIGDSVLALYNSFNQSYAPGHILTINNYQILVQFFDKSEKMVNKKDVFLLNRQKYESDAFFIDKMSSKLVGEIVIARNNSSRLYEFAKIVSKLDKNSLFLVEYAFQKQAIQEPTHIFSFRNKTSRIYVSDYVLAQKDTFFMPGQVKAKQGIRLKVKFIDSTTDDMIDVNDCFLISKEYYIQALEYLNH